MDRREGLRQRVARAACEGAGDDFDAFGAYWVETHYADTADAIITIVLEEAASIADMHDHRGDIGAAIRKAHRNPPDTGAAG